MSLLWDEAVVFLNSTAILTRIGQFLDPATIAFSERNEKFSFSVKRNKFFQTSIKA